MYDPQYGLRLLVVVITQCGRLKHSSTVVVFERWGIKVFKSLNCVLLFIHIDVDMV